MLYGTAKIKYNSLICSYLSKNFACYVNFLAELELKVMIVVSDTTALTNLLKVGYVQILKDLFGKILIPTAVDRELKKIEHHEKFLNSCDWIEVESPVNVLAVTILRTFLGEGESEAIILAQERRSDFLIMDELNGRSKAKELGIKIIGLLGVLLEAKKEGKIDAAYR